MHRRLQVYLLKLLDMQAFLLCDLPSTIKWQRACGSSYTLSGRWARRVKLGLVGLVDDVYRSSQSAGYRLALTLRLIREADVHALHLVLSLIKMQTGTL